jgi:hypothetical protein
MWNGLGRRHLSFEFAVERNHEGWQRAWCLNLAGCAATVRPGGDVLPAAHTALVEFLDWERASVSKHPAPSDLKLLAAQTVTGDLRDGTFAFFPHDGEPATVHEFPGWANAHDLALDEFCDVVARLPDTFILNGGQTMLTLVAEATHGARVMAEGLGQRIQVGGDPAVKTLREAHRRLQECVCAVDPSVVLETEHDRWSVRRIMRVSTWSLRRQTWRARRDLARLWVDG